MVDSNNLEITILKYDSLFSKRNKDLKATPWFSFPNDLLTHPDFFKITGDELKWFVWCLSICSKKMKKKIILDVEHGSHILSLSSDSLFSMCTKLEGKQIDVTEWLRPSADREPTVSRPYDGPNITEHNKTLHNITQQASNPENEEPAQSAKAVARVEVSQVEIKLSSSKSILVKNDLVQSWAETYPKDFLELSVKEMRNWVLANPGKAPKSAWAKFMNGWFQRGWERYRTTLKSNPVKVTAEDLEAFLTGEL